MLSTVAELPILDVWRGPGDTIDNIRQRGETRVNLLTQRCFFGFEMMYLALTKICWNYRIFCPYTEKHRSGKTHILA